MNTKILYEILDSITLIGLWCLFVYTKMKIYNHRIKEKLKKLNKK